MPFCTECGNEASETDKFCSSCGNLQKTLTKHPPGEKPALTKISLKKEKPNIQSKKKINLLNIIGWTIGLLIILMGFLLLEELLEVGLLFSLSGLFLIPPFGELLESKRIFIPGKLKVIISIILILGATAFIPEESPNSTSPASDTSTIIQRETSGSDAVKICYQKAEKCARGVPRTEREMKYICDRIYDATGVSYRLADYVNDLC